MDKTKLMRIILAVILGLVIVSGVVYNCLSEENLEQAYIICMPNDRVNIRLGPSRTSSSEGWCEAGDIVYLDGKFKHGYAHCVGLGVEAGEGWIHKGYIVYEEPEYVNCSATIVSKSRLAARKYVGGKRTRWLKAGAQLKVYYWTESWSLTNCGYVQSKFLELNGV